MKSRHVYAMLFLNTESKLRTWNMAVQLTKHEIKQNLIMEYKNKKF